MNRSVILVTLVVIASLLIPSIHSPLLPLSVKIIKVYDVGDVGYWDVVCLMVTNNGNSPINAIFILYQYNSGKRWVVSNQVLPFAPYSQNFITIPPHSTIFVNISAPSPLYFIPPFTRIFVQVYNMSTYNFVNSPVYITPNITRPPIINPDFSILYYSGKYNRLLPWGWYIEMTPNTTIYYNNALYVDGTALLFQPVFINNVTVIGKNVNYTVQDDTLYILVHNGYVKCVRW